MENRENSLQATAGRVKNFSPFLRQRGGCVTATISPEPGFGRERGFLPSVFLVRLQKFPHPASNAYF